jgi:hypothetical protein
MPSHSIAALVLTPLVAGAVCTVALLIESSPNRTVSSAIVNFGVWALIALAFEVAAPLPIAARFRASRHFRVYVFAVGLVAWYLLFALVWFFGVRDVPLREALVVSSLPMAVPGIALVATFAVLWRGAWHA